MKKPAIWILAAIIIIGGVVGIVAANRNSSKTTNTSTPATTPSTPSSTSSNSQTSSTTPSSSSTVTIQGFAFSPAAITVKKGTTVTWTNQDSTAHTVQETDGQTGPKSGNLANGASYSFTYATAGTFHYHCSIHPDMTGTVTVTD